MWRYAQSVVRIDIAALRREIPLEDRISRHSSVDELAHRRTENLLGAVCAASAATIPHIWQSIFCPLTSIMKVSSMVMHA